MRLIQAIRTSARSMIACAAVLASFASGTWGQEFKNWQTFQSPYGLGFLLGIAVDPSDNVWVSSRHTNIVQYRDKAGNWNLIASGGSGLGQFYDPYGMAFDSVGNVWIADASNGRIQVRRPNGSWQSYGNWGSAIGELQFGTFLILETDGSVLVSDGINNRLQRLSPNGSWFHNVSLGPALSGTANPHAMAFDRSGGLWLSEFAYDRVQRRTPDGVWHLVPGTLSRPIGLAIGPDGNVWVAERDNGRLMRRNSQGQWTAYGTPGSGIGQFSGPHGIAFDSEGNLWIADTFNSRIVKFTPDLEESTPPTSTVSLSPTTPASGWHKGNVTVNLAAADNTGGSGVKEIRYTVDMGAEQVISGASGSFTVSSEGVHTIAFWSKDNNSNTEATQYATVKIDKTAPAVTPSASGGVLTVGATDALSGVANVAVRVDSGAWTPYTVPFALPMGAQIVRLRATDNAGNTSAETVLGVGNALKSLTVSPSPVYAGSVVSVRVDLAFPAPAGGLLIPLHSSAPTVLALPASVSVPAGATFTTLTAVAGPVNTDMSVRVEASHGETWLSRAVAVLVPVPKTLIAKPSVVAGGTPVTLTITLVSKAPAGGQVVHLESLDPGVLSVPASTTVAAGATTKSVVGTTSVPTTDRSVLVSATVDGDIAVCAVAVRRIAVSSLTVSPSTVTGGTGAQLTVKLNRPAPPGGVVVPIVSTGGGASAPASITVAAGASTASVAVVTTPLARDDSAVFRAQLGGSSVRADLSILAPRLASLTTNPPKLVGGGSSTGVVALTGPAPATGVVVRLAHTGGSAVSLPSTVTVPSGATTASFPITTNPVSTDTVVTINATVNFDTKKATLTVGK